MKFLDLNTGYSFDGLWKNIDSWSNWSIKDIKLPDPCDVCGYVDDSIIKEISNFTNDPYKEIYFSSKTGNILDPDKSPEDWTNEFDIYSTCKIATRTGSTQSKGYTFWFPKEQSTNITYSMPICICLSKIEQELDENGNPIPLKINIEDNNIFSFINHEDNDITLDCCTFKEPVYSNEFVTTPELVNGHYLHLFNVAATSKYEGEFICKINIEDKGYIRVGADFYGEAEPVYVNLSNFGVEIPDTVQKAIYDSNLHEDYKDNILVNRKFKELLSNYWDIVANKGSYKSLKNSIDWFEWDDLLKIKEIWKRDEAGFLMFDDRDVMSIFENKLADSYNNFIKTSYIGLYCLMYSDSDNYDIEYNPILVENSMKWAKNDLRIKLALLTQFFGNYFLPIHLSILYSTLEDQVYTNTIKTICGTNISRQDSFGDFNYVTSNIKNGCVFKLSNVRTYINKNTVFSKAYKCNYEIEKEKFLESDIIHKEIEMDNNFSVELFPNNEVNELEGFFNTYYAGTGTIIPINLNIKNQEKYDFIKQTILNYNGQLLKFYDVFNVKNKEININFNFLAKEAGKYNLVFTFITALGKTITKEINFSVEDVDNLNINIYKVQAKNDKKGLTYSDFANTDNYKYFFRIQPSIIKRDEENNPVIDNTCYYMQYLPYMHPDNELFNSYNGIKLNRTVVIKITDEITKYELINIRNWFNRYLEFQRKKDGKLTYLIFVSKYFYEELPEHIYEHPEYEIIRNDLVFYPQFHNLIRMNGLNENNYTVSQYEAVCCAPEINVDKNTVKPFKYGNQIKSHEWTFINSTNGEIIYHPSSSRQPFVVKDNGIIKPGYYDVIFNYSLTTGIENMCKLNSAFRIKVI